MIRVLRETVFSEMDFFSFLSSSFYLDLSILVYKTCKPSKIFRGGDRGVREVLGMDKSMGVYISPHLMFSITFVSGMHFHNHLSISISPKIVKD